MSHLHRRLPPLFFYFSYLMVAWYVVKFDGNLLRQFAFLRIQRHYA